MAYKQVQKIENQVPAADKKFGRYVLVDGHHMFVTNSAPGERIFIYKRNISGEWDYQGNVVSNTIDGSYPMASHGDYFVTVSGPTNKTLDIYYKDSFSSKLLTFSPTVETSSYGSSTSMSENYIVVGDQGDDSNTGSIYIYEKSGTDSWTAYSGNPLVASDGVDNDYFGSAVAIDGDESIIVGARGDSQGRGAAYVFKKDANTDLWEQSQKLVASDGLPNDRFGESLSASEGHFVVGASLKDSDTEVNVGAAYVFKHSTVWYEVDKLSGVGETTYEGNHFGESVSIDRNNIIVGSPNARNEKGVADIFAKDRSWGHLRKLVASDPTAGDNFGTGVSISGRFSVVGSPDFESATTGGAAYVYENPQVVLRLAQEFEVNSKFVPTKTSVHLKRVGKNVNNYWTLKNTEKTVIDATNFSTIDKEENIVIFDDTVAGFTGGGYMIMNEDNPSFDQKDQSIVNYPIRALNPDTYYIWIRCINTDNNNFNIEVLIDGKVTKTIGALIDNPSDGLEWRWVSTTIVIPDNREHILGIRIKENNVAIDKIYIDAENITPYTEGPDHTESPYLTTHMKVYDSLKGEPGVALYIYDYKNSITEVIQDDWYNFDIKVLDNTHGYLQSTDFSENYYLVMSTSGSSSSNFITWELVDNDEYTAPSSAIKF